MLMVERLRSGWSVAQVAAAQGVDPRTVRKRRARRASEGEAGLRDRSSRPHSSPNRIAPAACDLLYERVLPFYDELGVEVGAVPADNGGEFCGRPEQHPCELLLGVEGVEHRTTRVRSPRTNAFDERMNRTLLDECFRVKGRTTWYMASEEIQRDLDVFIAFYNEQRTHQGYRLKGRTPAQALREALGVERLPAFAPPASQPEAEEDTMPAETT